MITATLDTAQLVTALRRVQDALAENVPEALELCADLVAVEAKQTTAFEDRSGSLRNSIASDGVTGSLRSGLAATVAAGAPHGIYVELGTRAHKIEPKHRKALRWPVEGGFAFAKAVNHPGTAPRKFLSGALDAKMVACVEVLNDAVALSFQRAGFAS